MQTMPAFVYLVPVVALFAVGRVPGVIASVIYALPLGIRLTNLAIRQVPKETVEAAEAYGASPVQLLRRCSSRWRGRDHAGGQPGDHARPVGGDHRRA